MQYLANKHATIFNKIWLSHGHEFIECKKLIVKCLETREKPGAHFFLVAICDFARANRPFVHRPTTVYTLHIHVILCPYTFHLSLNNNPNFTLQINKLHLQFDNQESEAWPPINHIPRIQKAIHHIIVLWLLPCLVPNFNPNNHITRNSKGLYRFCNWMSLQGASHRGGARDGPLGSYHTLAHARPQTYMKQITCSEGFFLVIFFLWFSCLIHVGSGTPAFKPDGAMTFRTDTWRLENGCGPTVGRGTWLGTLSQSPLSRSCHDFGHNEAPVTFTLSPLTYQPFWFETLALLTAWTKSKRGLSSHCVDFGALRMILMG